jgi:hypothetical protein
VSRLAVASVLFLLVETSWAQPPARPPAAAAILEAARGFVATLDADERDLALRPFKAAERLDWGYVPRPRQGLPLSRMRPSTRVATTQLLRAALSEAGARKVDAIVALEDVLRSVEGWSGRDSGLYYVTVFGEPSGIGAWGWRYEGHHLSLHWTVLDGAVVGSAPQFLGSNPAEVRGGPQRGRRALAAEEDLARAILASLTPAQRSRAVVAAQAPADIVTGNSRQASIQERRGIAWGDLDARQQGLLLTLLHEYAAIQAPAIAAERLAQIRGELPSIVFAWMGGSDKGQGHYYRIQGSSFLVEYDNTQNGANHIHCVWREFHGDWGQDALAAHYRQAAHHRQAGSADPKGAHR